MCTRVVRCNAKMRKLSCIKFIFEDNDINTSKLHIFIVGSQAFKCYFNDQFSFVDEHYLIHTIRGGRKEYDIRRVA